jgi:hypothetical protein
MAALDISLLIVFNYFCLFIRDNTVYFYALGWVRFGCRLTPMVLTGRIFAFNAARISTAVNYRDYLNR